MARVGSESALRARFSEAADMSSSGFMEDNSPESNVTCMIFQGVTKSAVKTGGATACRQARWAFMRRTP
jgi:hypothetical protein